MVPFNFKTFSRLKPGTYYTYEWNEGEKLLSRIASVETLALSLGARNFRFSHRIRKEMDVSEAEIVFEFDTGDKFTCGEIVILIEFMRKVDKRDIVTVISRTRRVPSNLFEYVLSLFLRPQLTLSIGSYEPKGLLSAYFAVWARDEDIERIRECVEKVTGRCLDPFGMM